MAYSEFTLESVRETFGLDLDQMRLFTEVPPHAVSSELLENLNLGVTLALRSNTASARSNFVVAPIMLALKVAMAERVDVFSGVTLNVDGERGLSGVCDFLITEGGFRYSLTAPVLAVVAVANDPIGDSFGRCVAEMLAVQRYNELGNAPQKAVFGVATSGLVWCILRLVGRRLLFHQGDLIFSSPNQLVGTLIKMMRSALAPNY